MRGMTSREWRYGERGRPECEKLRSRKLSYIVEVYGNLRPVKTWRGVKGRRARSAGIGRGPLLLGAVRRQFPLPLPGAVCCRSPLPSSNAILTVRYTLLSVVIFFLRNLAFSIYYRQYTRREGAEMHYHE